jgi:peptide/nickel transport system permease protein
VTFIIINLAPGDPVTVTEISPEGQANRKEGSSFAFGSDDRYLQFRENYGLTLPILFNSWTMISQEEVKQDLWRLINRKENPKSSEEMTAKEYDALRIKFGDQARFIMPRLLHVIEDPQEAPAMRSMAARFFIRGGTLQGYVGPHISDEERKKNRKIAEDNNALREMAFQPLDPPEKIEKKTQEIQNWYDSNRILYHYEPDFKQKLYIFFFETRFFKYFSKVLTLDFGTLRNDNNKTVISEVTKRFKYSLTLSLVPMIFSLLVCLIFGFLMAARQNDWQDHALNIFFLSLYATPIFVVAPFLIEKVALHHTFPFTNIPIPISGFTNPETLYERETSLERLYDILQHICLPLVAIMYGSLAAQARLTRTAVLEVMRQDYIRTAKAKGLPPMTILYKHVGRNAAITIVTSVAGSLGIVLGGSLIVETLFGINGFGKFFYDAIVNRDYNVILFSALAGSFLTLAGYIVADIAYMLLDPRLTLD